MTRGRTNRRHPFGVFLAVLVAAGCGNDVEITYSPYEFEAPDGSLVQAELGQFQVPENRQDRSSRDITLSFVRLESTAEDPGPPIVYLAGGPGGSGIAELYGRRYEMFDRLRAVADVIAFDQRGTGRDAAVPFCETPAEARPSLAEPLTRERAIDWYVREARRCLDFWEQEGVDMSGYTSVESARDLETLRRGLGADRLSLWSISYGSHLAMAAMKEMGDRIDRVVMAAAEGPDETVKLPARSEEFLEHVDEMVREHPAVGDRYPDLLRTMHDVLDRVEADPVTVTVGTRDGQSVEVGISRFLIQIVTGFAIKNPSELRSLPALYYSMAGGDFSLVANFALQIHQEFMGGLQGMTLAMDYSSGASKDRLETVERQARTAAMGDALNFPMPHVMGELDLPDLGDGYRRPVETDIPTLFLSGTLDGRTYLPSHEETKRGFRNAHHVVIENAGHDMFMSHPALLDIVADFFAGTDIGERRIELPLPDFY